MPESKFLFPASRESRRLSNHCARLSSRCVPLPAACTQIGSPDRNTCTVCTNAAQIRTSGTSLGYLAAQSHTAHNAIRPESRAYSRAGVRKSDPSAMEVARLCQTSPPIPFAHYRDRDPGIHVDGIWPQCLPKQYSHSLAEFTPAASTLPCQPLSTLDCKKTARHPEDAGHS